ncbi:MAG: DUF5684 domain-containing protein [Candidatus Tenebribacter davisii]|nr:DUF5684 domain-containing protein [Candidatus Tenebribacter davisii]
MYDNMYASEMNSGPGIVFWIFYYALIIFMIVVMWKIFVKAGKPGWGCIIPIYSIILVLEITDRPIWWIILWFFFSPIMYIIFCLDIAKAFRKGTGFGIGLILLPFIFFPILAFDSSEYQETVHIENQPL